jgi:hypothetical protein
VSCYSVLMCAVANTTTLSEALLERTLLCLLESYRIATVATMESRMFIAGSFIIVVFEGSIVNANEPAAFKLAVAVIAAIAAVASALTHRRMGDRILGKIYV